MKNDFSISLVVPVLNEEDSLLKLYDEICDSLTSFKKWEIIFIDDGSNDHSYSILKNTLDNKRFSGFISRCITCLLCKY